MEKVYKNGFLFKNKSSNKNHFYVVFGRNDKRTLTFEMEIGLMLAYEIAGL